MFLQRSAMRRWRDVGGPPTNVWAKTPCNHQSHSNIHRVPRHYPAGSMIGAAKEVSEIVHLGEA